MILSLQLPFAVFPLVQFTPASAKMGGFAAPLWMQALAWPVAVVIAVLNVWLLYQIFFRAAPGAPDAVYKRILVAIEHSPADATILSHVLPLAR